ncbi:DUF5689 domain-containing protein [Pseudotenacibaculum haliotis]|uniref:DUF5689 domain-containing protein n=1 Tax=Pseudotenacibaculum haliotis TaxID=1862138 RepID=A0ABW5LRX3_9FLAO
MKKNYFLTLLLTLCLSAFSFGQIIITEIADPNNDFSARYVELYNVSGSSVDLTGWKLRRWTNGNTGPTTSADVDLSPIGNLASGGFVLISNNASNFQTVYGITADIDAGTGGPADSNGDDQIAVLNSSDTIIDIFGVPGEDGSNTCHEFEDGRAERKGTVTASVDTWDESEWNVWSDGSTASGCTSHTSSSPRTAPADFDPGAWIGTSSDPTLSISAPSANQVFNPETTEVSASLSILNFTLSGDAGGGVSDNSGDGYIATTLQETGQSDVNSNYFTATPPAITVVAGRSYTLTAELVDNSGNSLTPAVTASVSFSVASYTQVADIATLRAGTEGNYYELTGQATMTYDAMNSRNQKYIQDGTAAILIDDADGTVTTSYNVGDGITGIRGQLSSFGGVLQIVPQVDPGAATATGLPVTPQVVTIADLDANFNDYESEWITINDVTFNDADGTATFSSGTNYDITDGTNTLVFRTQFSGADFIGSVIPTSSANITGIAAEFNGTSQIFATSSSNIVLSVQRNDIEGYSAYPNPVRGNSFTITTNSIDKKQVVLFNVLGRKVFSQSFSGTRKTMDIPNLTPGVYVLKVTEGAKIATQKLIIE